MKSDSHLKVLLPIVLMATCSRTPESAAGQPGTGTPPYAPPPLIAWLDCVECTPDQLRAVSSLGDAAVPELRTVLLSGPPPDRLDREQKRLEAMYQALKEYERQHPGRGNQVPFATQQQYLQFYLQKYVLLNRVRAARALGAIATPAARSALDEADRLPDLPDELKDQVRIALDRR